MESTAIGIFGSLVTALPMMMAWVICAIFAFTKWKQNPTAAKVVVAVAILSFIDFVFGMIYYRAITPMIYDSFGYDGGVRFFQSFVGFCRSIFRAFLFCLLVWGAFSKSAAKKEAEVFS